AKRILSTSYQWPTTPDDITPESRPPLSGQPDQTIEWRRGGPGEDLSHEPFQAISARLRTAQFTVEEEQCIRCESLMLDRVRPRHRVEILEIANYASGCHRRLRMCLKVNRNR